MSEQLPKVSIIIPAYNSAKTLPICLKSLENQTYSSEKYEVIIVNDGSNDNTERIVKSLALSPIFKVISYSKNKGRPFARNTAIRYAEGNIIIFLDSDIEVDKNFIEKHVNLHQRRGVMGVTGIIKPASDYAYDKFQKYIYEAKRGVKKYNPDKPISYKVFLSNQSSVKRDVFEKVGLFDENIQFYGEDTEFAYRIWLDCPEGLYYDPTIVSIHHHYRSLDQHLKLIENFGEKSIPYILEKHPDIAYLYGIGYLNVKIEPFSTGRNVFKILVGYLIKNRAFQDIIRILYSLTPFPLSNQLVRIMLASSLLRGIDKAFKSKKYKMQNKK
jgi:glycosyltransferase involved in cell wall biosynthesis